MQQDGAGQFFGQAQQQQRYEGGAGQCQDNEFDAGRRMMEIGDRLRTGIRDIVASLRDRQRYDSGGGEGNDGGWTDGADDGGGWTDEWDE